MLAAVIGVPILIMKLLGPDTSHWAKVNVYINDDFRGAEEFWYGTEGDSARVEVVERGQWDADVDWLPTNRAGVAKTLLRRRINALTPIEWKLVHSGGDEIEFNACCVSDGAGFHRTVVISVSPKRLGK